jgi:cellobiose phosphorylase
MSLEIGRNEYGYFDQDWNYRLENPATPRPWMHLLSNKEYLLSISQLGTGYSCFINRNGNQVTRNQDFDDRHAGRFFYIRLPGGEFFCPTVYPSHSGLEKYSNYCCKYHPGSLSWDTTFQAVRSQLSVIVSLAENVELYRLRLENLSSLSHQLDCFLALEWEFGGAPPEFGAVIRTQFNQDINALIADLATAPENRFHQTGFITCSEHLADYDSRYLAFLGPLGTITAPAAVVKGKCSNSGCPILGSTCGAVRVSVEIEAGKSKEILSAVGVARDIDSAKQIIPRLHDTELFEKESAAVDAHWRGIYGSQVMDTPHNSIQKFSSTWLKYQVVQNARWNRWAVDKGYRDILQDSAAMRLLAPAETKSMIRSALKNQKSDGHAPRQWSTVPWASHNWKDYRDSCFWLVYAVDAYLRETGDTDFLDERIGFIDKHVQRPVWEHLTLAMEYLFKHRGAHGLCLMGQGDWLDSLNRAGLQGRGESVWLTQALAWALKRIVEIARASGRSGERPAFEKMYDSLFNALNDGGWDGRWYLMGYTDDGEKIGSASSPYGGNLFLNPQSWAVLSETATKDRAALCFEAVEENLSTGYGYMLYGPRYTKYCSNIGRLSIGSSETDSVYVHAVTFKIMADCMLRNADRAWQTIVDIVPASGRLPASQSGAEPFCCVNAFAGRNWSRPGWSYVGWWTGTASWLFQIMLERIYGARADYNGLTIDPLLPSEFKEASITRQFRGSTYRINYDRLGQGSASHILLDGKPLKGHTITAFNDGKTHTVRCGIGACDAHPSRQPQPVK